MRRLVILLSLISLISQKSIAQCSLQVYLERFRTSACEAMAEGYIKALENTSAQVTAERIKLDALIDPKLKAQLETDQELLNKWSEKAFPPQAPSVGDSVIRAQFLDTEKDMGEVWKKIATDTKVVAEIKVMNSQGLEIQDMPTKGTVGFTIYKDFGPRPSPISQEEIGWKVSASQFNYDPRLNPPPDQEEIEVKDGAKGLSADELSSEFSQLHRHEIYYENASAQPSKMTTLNRHFAEAVLANLVGSGDKAEARHFCKSKDLTKFFHSYGLRTPEEQEAFERSQIRAQAETKRQQSTTRPENFETDLLRMSLAPMAMAFHFMALNQTKPDPICEMLPDNTVDREPDPSAPPYAIWNSVNLMAPPKVAPAWKKAHADWELRHHGCRPKFKAYSK